MNDAFEENNMEYSCDGCVNDEDFGCRASGGWCCLLPHSQLGYSYNMKREILLCTSSVTKDDLKIVLTKFQFIQIL